MRKLLRNLALVVVATAGALSCTETEINEQLEPKGEKLVLCATTPSGETTTKVEFTDEGDEGIALEWEEGDEFTLYDSNGVEIDTFINTSGNEFTSSKDGVTLVKGDVYTAKYNEDANLASQDGDAIASLDSACQMEATFTAGRDDVIEFSHTMAIMTFKFNSAKRPAKLVFENGDKIYEVNYGSIAPVDGIYTSHIMIEPCKAVERKLVFSLYDSEDKAYDVRQVTSKRAYNKGMRYTAKVSSLENLAGSISGSGTKEDPYKIATADQLRELSVRVNGGETFKGEYFEMTNNIDLGGIDSENKGIADKEFTAIGNFDNSFKGTFDGGDYTIEGLYINQPDVDMQGFFGYAYNASIKNLTVDGRVSGRNHVGGVVGEMRSGSLVENCYNCAMVSGHDHVGGVVGYSSSYYSVTSSITACYNTGSVSGSGNVGGVVGCTQFPVTACYNTGSVSGRSDVGGVVGSTTSSVCPITACYNRATVSGNYCVGGVVGDSFSPIITCYNTGSVSGDSSSVGGVVGSASYNSPVTACYNAGSVSGSSDVGGVVGQNKASKIIACYNTGLVSGSINVGGLTSYDVYFSGKITDCYYIAGAGYGEGTNVATLAELNDVVEAMNSAAGSMYFTVNSGNLLPSLFDEEVTYENKTKANDAIISTVEELKAFRDLVNADPTWAPTRATLTADIDLNGEEWTPIAGYTGAFDGDGHTISNLTINSTKSYQGLFSSINSGSISNLIIENPQVQGVDHTSAICGYAKSAIITSCSVVGGSVSGGGNVGGVVGYGDGSYITACYNTASVSGSSVVDSQFVGEYVGGVVGDLYDSDIINCYNAGSVLGESSVGGVVGCHYGSSVTACYNTGSVSGGNYVGGVVGLASNNAPVIACYNTASVLGNEYVGGVVGFAYSSVNSCYNTGSVSCSSNVGGVVGYIEAFPGSDSLSPSVTACHYLPYSDLTYTNTKGTANKNLVATMKSADFPATLNTAAKDDYFEQDVNNYNDGDPILSAIDYTTMQ